MKTCFFCKKEIEIEEKVGRSDSCPFCRSDLHCCFNCRFYDEKVSNQCREPQAERVTDKDKANFCEYFTFRDSSSSSSQEEERRKAKEKLDALFKKGRGDGEVGCWGVSPYLPTTLSPNYFGGIPTFLCSSHVSSGGFAI